MDESQLDRIHIRDLRFRCIVGVDDRERSIKQDVVVNITLWADLSAATKTDALADTVDYRAVKQEVLAMAEQSAYQLVESLAESIAAICLAHDRVERARVLVEKPSALRFARTVGIEIDRRRRP